MVYITYSDMVRSFGRNAASELLETIERAGVPNDSASLLDDEARLELALQALNHSPSGKE